MIPMHNPSKTVPREECILIIRITHWIMPTLYVWDALHGLRFYLKGPV